MAEILTACPITTCTASDIAEFAKGTSEAPISRSLVHASYEKSKNEKLE